MSKLREILEHKLEEVEEIRRHVPMEEMRERASDAPSVRGFRERLVARAQPIGLIAEVKRASPSRGVIREDFDPVDIAKQYEAAGAHCLSVLTDVRYFQGSMENMINCRKATALPVLRKDFIAHPYQVYQSRAAGADAILLISAALEPGQLRDLHGLARACSMDVLVEVHTEEEAEAALAVGAPMIGVNNRDLNDLSTSLDVSARILPMLRGRALRVSESAIDSHEDVERVAAVGAEVVLIGTAFCSSPDVGAKVKEVMGW